MTLPKRKPTQLKGYDYSQNGAYFITICTHNKEHILSKIVGEGLCALPKNTLTPIGTETEKAILYINENYIGVKVDKYVIMPNHIHLIIIITNNSGGHRGPPLQSIIGQLKSYSTNKYGNILWQRSFHDHIIRSENDYQKIWKYIDTNVIRWKNDCFYNN
ncbi:MAG: transposase [Clostridia bacterium]|nr:transposase [Clostridia bacterium]